MEWISVKERLPELNQNVICFQPAKKASGETEKRRARILMGYLFKIEPGERDGWIEQHVLFIKDFSLLRGGTFWAFPYICHQNFVTHWMPLPEHPSAEEKV